MEQAWRFGPYLLSAARRRLECDGVEVALGARSFGLLVELVRRAGEVLSKAELMAAVWGNIVVDDSSVRVHISLLRKVLAAPAPRDGEWIANLPLRGYTFCGHVEALAEVPPRPPELPAPVERLPLRVSPGQLPRGALLVGRAADNARALALLEHNMLVTLVGPGGIGKTVAALAVARDWVAGRQGSAVFVDLVPASTPAQVLAAIGGALGVGAELNGTVDTLRLRLARRPTLLLLDNCEHALDALAPIAAALQEGAAGLRMLATSREALLLPGECVLRLAALAAPAPGAVPTLAEALQYPAIELLAVRAAATGAGPLLDTDAPLLAAIAQRLDGIPLALELVAARLAVMTPADLAARLDEHMQLQLPGGRTVQARHQTMAAALDWSLALLDSAELRLFRRLSVFCDAFDLEAALRIAGEGLDADGAFVALGGLVAKSLVTLDHHAAAPYRLLAVTRAYAARHLEDSGERDAALARHAAWVFDATSASLHDLPALNSAQWDARYGHLLGDVRGALDWALTRAPTLACDLTIVSETLWFHRSQVAEYRERLQAALAAPLARQDPGVATRLRLTLGSTLWHTSPTAAPLLPLFARALQDCPAGSNAALRARWGTCIALTAAGEYRAAAAMEPELVELAGAATEPALRQLGPCAEVLTGYYRGRFAATRIAAHRLLAMLAGRGPLREMWQVDGTVAVNAVLARTLWIEGRAADACAAAQRALEVAQGSGHALSLCFALFGTCQVHLWSGDTARASEHVGMMLAESERRDLGYWHAWAQCYAACLGAASIEAGGTSVQRREMLATCRPDFDDATLVRRALAGEGGWADAEILRCAGVRLNDAGRVGEGIGLLRHALGLARQQGALAWQQRCTASLASVGIGPAQAGAQAR